jgi:hypothetical protein
MRIVALACVIALAAGCGGAAEDRSANLVDVESVLPLRAAFDSDRGSPRLLVVLSPT